MELLQAREGRSQVLVLSAVADFQYNQDLLPRVKDLDKALRLSKGAISNNTKKLLNRDLIQKEEKRFSIKKETLMRAYREHFEQFLIREPDSKLFSEDVQSKNQIRTRTKKKLNDWFANQTIRDMMIEILIQALLAVRELSWLQTLREVFFYADRLVQNTHEEIEEKMWEGKQKGSGGEVREAFDHFAQCMDWGTSRLDKVFRRMSEGSPIFENGKLRAEIKQKLQTFCEENQIQRLTLFGSAVREDFTPISDVDVLVKFKETKSVGLIELSRLERRLEDIFGRKVDLTTEQSLTDEFRDRICGEMSVKYEAA